MYLKKNELCNNYSPNLIHFHCLYFELTLKRRRRMAHQFPLLVHYTPHLRAELDLHRRALWEHNYYPDGYSTINLPLASRLISLWRSKNRLLILSACKRENRDSRLTVIKELEFISVGENLTILWMKQQRLFDKWLQFGILTAVLFILTPEDRWKNWKTDFIFTHTVFFKRFLYLENFKNIHFW